MMMKKFQGETYQEAFFKAKSELGEEVLIVTSKVYQQKSWGGIFSQEMVEVTAAVPREDVPKIDKNAPLRPVLAETITNHPQISAIRQARPALPIGGYSSSSLPSSGEPPRSFEIPPTPPPRIPPNGGKSASERYKKLAPAVSGPSQELRTPHAMRSNQEGAAAPYSQHSADDTQSTEKMRNLLGEILKKKHEEVLPPAKSHGYRAGPPLRDQAFQSTTSIPRPACPPHEAPRAPTAQSLFPQFQTATDGSINYHEFVQKFNELAGILQQLHRNSENALHQSVCSYPPGIQHIRDALIRMEICHDILEEMLEEFTSHVPFAVQNSIDESREDFEIWLSKRIKMAPPEPSRSRRPSTLILLGPTGVGKTTTIAKLAANYAFNLENRKKVALFTLDTYRIGAPAQLHQYAEIIEAKLEVLFESGDIVEARKRHVEKDVILVDTAGRCQKNADELRELKDLLSHFPDSKRYLVLSATTKFSDMQENVKRFGEVGFDQLIFTKVDETNSLGPLIALLYSSQKPLAYLTNGQNVPADFLEGSVSFFLDKIFSTPED